MMDDGTGTGSKVDRLHPSIRFQSERNDKIPVNIRTIGRYGKGGGHGDNQVWLTQTPACRKLRKWWQLRGISLGHSGLDPLSK